MTVHIGNPKEIYKNLLELVSSVRYQRKKDQHAKIIHISIRQPWTNRNKNDTISNYSKENEILRHTQDKTRTGSAC